MDGVRTFLLFISITHLFAVNGEQIIPREALEIIIGGGGATPSPPPENQNCPPPPPTPCPPPPTPTPTPKPPPSPPKITPRPPSPPKVTPPPSPPKVTLPRPPSDGFESERLKLVFPVIQKFKLKVQDRDPKGITKTWKGKKICGVYKGFVCDMIPKYNQKALAGVKFNNFNFGVADLNDFLINLPDLVFFHANSNNFTGSIPSNLNTLPFLYELDLSNNKFSGNFPYQVLRGNKLLFLDLRFNTFAGVVPPEIFRLNLDLLFINNNKFVQNLPDNLGKTTALYLTLANNEFTGPIPPSIGQASNTLLEVLFLNNKLTGCLPYEIGLLRKATVFDVGSNYLTGPIPHSFQCLKKMELLNLAHNKFSGVVPEAVCSLPKLSNFTLSYNYFTQVGPQCRKLIKKGVLNVDMNCIFDLPKQRSPADCDHFFSTPHDSCVNAKSLTYVPCSHGYSGAHQLDAVDGQLTTGLVMAPAPAQAPRRGYGALSPH